MSERYNPGYGLNDWSDGLIKVGLHGAAREVKRRIGGSKAEILSKIEARNQKVERDKAWETSWGRTKTLWEFVVKKN